MPIVHFEVAAYDLEATLNSGQAFRWVQGDGLWEGVIGNVWARLTPTESGFSAEMVDEKTDWAGVVQYLQIETPLEPVLATFPSDPAMAFAVRQCHGLRLLRQDPWECLASFILSSTKQIVQIRQIIALLCERFGSEISAPEGRGPLYSFPTSEALAKVSEEDLRACKMGFRAPYLRQTARLVAEGKVDLSKLAALSVNEARAALVALPGVGRKIADCVLLFAYGFQEVFPIDVWVARTLRENYFRGRSVKLDRLHRFAARHFGPHAGYAQQYLFHLRRIEAAKFNLNPAVQTAKHAKYAK